MFPNPQDAFPLPPRPDLDYYRTLAKDLTRACRTEDAEAISKWSDRWLAQLAQLYGRPDASLSSYRRALTTYLTNTLAESCKLSHAQFSIARCHGFESWPRLVKHLEGLSADDSSVHAFERAVDAIVSGDLGTLTKLLRAKPELINARSTREHKATLLHYVSANGVENDRQKTPPNILEITRTLLHAGADVDAEADVYGGGVTTLVLVATSAHPLRAGVQDTLLELLIQHGASVAPPRIRRALIVECLANGCPDAAEMLARYGAAIDLESAAAFGNVDWVKNALAREKQPGKMLDTALRRAAERGRDEVVKLLLDAGADLRSGDEADRQTPLHWAVIGGHLSTVKLLLAHGAPLDVHNIYGGTPLGQALWSAAHGGDVDVYAEIIETLIMAGAKPAERHPPVSPEIDALLERFGSHADSNLWWYGEEPG